MNYVFHLEPCTDSPFQPSKRWLAEFRRSFPCLHRPPWEGLDVEIDSLGEDASLTFVDGSGTVVIRDDLYDCLAGFFVDDYRFGTLTNTAGSAIPSYRTIGARSELRLRGDKNSTRTVCGVCGRCLYYPMGRTYA